MTRIVLTLLLAASFLALAQQPAAEAAGKQQPTPSPAAPSSEMAAPDRPAPTGTADDQTVRPVIPGSGETSQQPQSDPGTSRGTGSLFGLLFPLLIFAVLYFVMVMPQQRRQKKHQQMLQALKRGDRIVLASGIFGFVTEVKENTVMAKIADNTVVEVEKGSIAARVGHEPKASGSQTT